MIAFTQSGYPVIPKYGDPRIAKTAPVNAAPGVLDEVVPIFNWVMTQFDKTVTPLIPAQCWGYAPRQIRGGTGWSNHASGTAVDLNATMFPQGQRRMTVAQVAACRAIVKQSGGAIRWGGDYTGSTAVDQQHFEIASINAARLFIARLKAKPTPTPPADDDLEPDMQVTFTDAYQYDQAIKAGKTDAEARKIALVTYTSTAKALAGLLSYLSSILRDVKTLLAKLDTKASTK